MIISQISNEKGTFVGSTHNFDADAIRQRVDCRDLMQQFFPQHFVRSKGKYDIYWSFIRDDGRKPAVRAYADGVKDFGGSGDYWDCFALTAEALNLSLEHDFPKICDYLSNGNILLADTPRPKTEQKPLEPPDAEWQAAIIPYVELWENNLWANPRVLDYLRIERGFSDEIIRQFRLGYNPDWCDIRCNGDILKAAPGITLPWFADNQLYAVRVRTRQGSLSQYSGHNDSYLDKYLSVTGSKPSAGLFNADGLIPNQNAVLVEGEFDCMLAAQFGLNAVTRGSAGDHQHINPQWLDKLTQADTVFSLLDNDTAGQNATDALLKQLKNVVPLSLPVDSNDLTDYVQTGGAIEALFRDLEQATHAAQERRTQLLKANKKQKSRRKQNKPRQQANMQRRDQHISTWAQPIELPTLAADMRVHLRYVSDVGATIEAQLLEHRSILIKSAIATGKTSLLENLIKRAESGKYGERVLIITHLENLAGDIANRFYDLGFVVYKDYLGTGIHWQAADRVVCSFDSLHLLAGQYFDIVAIDEFEQFIPHLWSGTMRGAEPVRAFTTLQQLIGSAASFIALDAHLTSKTQQFTEKLRGKDSITLCNEYQHDWGDLTLCQSPYTVMERGLEAAKTATKPVVFLTYRERSKALYQLCLDHGFDPDDIMLMNGDTSQRQAQKDFRRNINQNLGEVKILITSPTLATGIDIQTAVQGVYAIFDKQPLTPTKMLQMLGRCRKAGERWVWVQYADHQDFEINPITLYGQALLKVFETGDAADFDRYHIEAADNTQRQIQELNARWTADENKQRRMLFSSFVAYAKNEGYTIRYDNRNNSPMKERYKFAKKTVAEKQKELACRVEAIAPELHRELKKNGLSTDETDAGLLRWYIEDISGIRIIPELYNLFHTPEQRSRLRHYIDLQDDLEHIKALDRFEAQEGTLLVKRGHATVLCELVTEAIKAVFGDVGLDSTEELTKETITARLVDYLDEYKHTIRRHIDKRKDLSDDPLATFKRVLGKVGIKLASRQVMVNGERYYVYFIDSEHLALWRGIATIGLVYRQRKAQDKDSARDYLKSVQDLSAIRVSSNTPDENALKGEGDDVYAPWKHQNDYIPF